MEEAAEPSPRQPIFRFGQFIVEGLGALARSEGAMLPVNTDVSRAIAPHTTQAELQLSQVAIERTVKREANILTDDKYIASRCIEWKFFGNPEK